MKNIMITELYRAFIQIFDQEPVLAVRSPGRVNLIGDHTDYNEGFVLPMAIDPHVLALAAPSTTQKIQVYSLDYKQLSTFALGNIPRSNKAPWSDYIRGVTVALQKKGHVIHGADIAIAGNVPQGAGLSSSAALEMAAGFTLLSISGLPVDKVQLALRGQEAENHFVGVQSGIMDQYVSALGQEDSAICIDCRDLSYQAVPLGLKNRDLAIVVVASGERRGLIDSEYNTRRRECLEGVRLLQERLPNRSITALRDISMEDFQRYGSTLPHIIRKRVRHVVTENQRVQESVLAILDGNLERFGAMMYTSHLSLRDDYEVTVPAIDRLIELAHALPGVLGTRMTGGGFGGSTVHLVETDALEAFHQKVVQPYMQETGLMAPVYICRAVAGVEQIPIAVLPGSQ